LGGKRDSRGHKDIKRWKFYRFAMGKGINLINKNNRAIVPEKKECTMMLSWMRIFRESAKKTLS